MKRLVENAAWMVGLSLFGVSPALSQTSGGAELLALGEGELQSALQQRYDAGLAATLDPAVVAADDPRYLWASEAKVQCGIALGFLKSGTRDAVSVGKCALAYGLMQRPPRSQVPAQVANPQAPATVTPQARPEECAGQLAAIVFFDFDSVQLAGGAQQNIENVVTRAQACSWSRYEVVGHTDTSGSDDYNINLSRSRAEAVAERMASMGIEPAAIAIAARGESDLEVPTPDGVRSPQNRRVEITAN